MIASFNLSSPFLTSKSCILAFTNAPKAAIAAASIKFPSWSSTYMSTKTMKTFFPLSMHSFFKSIAFDSRIPLSTTRASSIEFSSGGPDSKVGEASGTNSELTVVCHRQECQEMVFLFQPLRQLQPLFFQGVLAPSHLPCQLCLMLSWSDGSHSLHDRLFFSL